MSTTTATNLPGIYMKLHNRKLLRKLMAIQEVSARQLARQAGWKSHSYMNRLLLPPDHKESVSTLDIEPAVRIARYLGVGVDDLFMPRVSSDAGASANRRSA